MIRDDRGGGPLNPPPLPADPTHPRYHPDAVLYDCPECGRAHLVVPECPDPTAGRDHKSPPKESQSP